MPVAKKALSITLRKTLESKSKERYATGPTQNRNVGVFLERVRESHEDLVADIHRGLRESNRTRSNEMFIALIIALGGIV